MYVKFDAVGSKVVVLFEITLNDGRSAAQGHGFWYQSKVRTRIPVSDKRKLMFYLTSLPYCMYFVKLSLLTVVPLFNSLIRDETMNSS